MQQAEHNTFYPFVLLDTIGEAVFVIDTQWRYTYVNKKAEELVGRPCEELLGNTIWELFPETVATIFSAEMHRAVQQNTPTCIETYYPPLQKWFESRIHPSAAGLVVLSQDITERKLLEVERGKYAALVSSSDDAIVSKTLDGTITSWNHTAERMFGYTAEEAIGQHITLIIPPELHQEEEDIIGKLRQGIRIRHYETVRVRKDGTKVDVSLSISPIIDRAGNIIGAAKIARDITERIELERRKDEFISMASHELKTPITTLKGFTDMLLRKLERQGMQEEVPMLTRMDAQINRLTRLIDELLDVSKVQAGRLDYEEEPVDLAALLRETVEILQPTSPTHPLIVKETTHAMIMGDKDRLGQVLTNLIGNAIKYSPQANQVDLSITTSNKTVTLRVRDYGVGIPKAHQKHIFDRFYRGRVSHNKAFPGLGMGLYIAHEIVKWHGGEITVESEEGKGSTFVVSLPLKK